jgi:hypothetical protein
MTTNLPPYVIDRCEWVRRCSVRIREIDRLVTLIDAADLANTLRDLECCRDLEPEEAARRLFQDNLTEPRFAVPSLNRPTKN